MKLEFNSIEEAKTFVASLKDVERSIPPIAPTEFAHELAKLARADKKISCIKLYRSVYGSTLKEAKDALDNQWGWQDF